MTIMDIRPFLAVGVSLAAAVMIAFSGRWPNLREFWSAAASFIKFGIILTLVPGVLDGNVYEWTLFNLTDTVGFTLRTDPAGMIFALLASLLWMPINFYSIGYMRYNREHDQTGYFAAFAVCMAAAVGIALSANLLTFFVFYELLTVASYPLVMHHRNKEAVSAGRKYLSYTVVSGQLLLAASVVVYCLAVTADFVPGGIL